MVDTVMEERIREAQGTHKSDYVIAMGTKLLGANVFGEHAWLEFTDPGVVRFSRAKDAQMMLVVLRSISKYAFANADIKELTCPHHE